MKRINNLYQQICSTENLQLADKKARKGKGFRKDIRLHDLNQADNILKLHEALINKTYSTSGYTTFKIYEPKERIIYKLSAYIDRVVQHGIMNIIEPVFMTMYTADTYSCIKGRGIHKALRSVNKALQDKENTTYCLKLDIKKFYPNVNHDILKYQLQRKFKDKNLLWLLFNLIDSAPGLPIGNYLSQHFANFYLTGFDHWLKETKNVKYYFRYADDIVILSHSKADLHTLLNDIRIYFNVNLKLQIKKNYQIFPVAARGINFVGYVSRHTHIFLRPSIKNNFKRMLKFRRNVASIASYNGWLKHANCRNLSKKLLS